MIKPINCFVRSYNRILTSMISDSIYELQFFQTIACFSFLNVRFKIEAENTFLSLRKVRLYCNSTQNLINYLVCFFGLL